MNLDHNMSDERCASLQDSFLAAMKTVVSTHTKRRDTDESYGEWAPVYDQGIKGYNGPEIVAEELARLMGHDRDVRVIDVGAGTGLVGQQLHKKGFLDIDALDCNDKMLAEAKSKNVYNTLLQETFGQVECSIPAESYDAVTVVGAFIPNHLNDTCFEELIRICKPGGYIIIATAEKHLFEPELRMFDSRLKQLEEDGLWTFLFKRRVEAYITIYNEKTAGVVIGLQKSKKL